jgi:hypothetical protein
MMLSKTINWLADHGFTPWAQMRAFVRNVSRIEDRLSTVERALAALRPDATDPKLPRESSI